MEDQTLATHLNGTSQVSKNDPSNTASQVSKNVIRQTRPERSPAKRYQDCGSPAWCEAGLTCNGATNMCLKVGEDM